MWRVKKLSGLAIALLVLGCSESPDTITDEKSTGMHFPSSLAQLTRPQIKIGELSADQVDKGVQVQGTVQESAPLLEGNLYLIEDETGTIWVFTLDHPPEIGTRVRTEGILQYEPIVISGADIGDYYLQEQSRSQLDNAAERLTD